MLRRRITCWRFESEKFSSGTRTRIKLRAAKQILWSFPVKYFFLLNGKKNLRKIFTIKRFDRKKKKKIGKKEEKENSVSPTSSRQMEARKIRFKTKNAALPHTHTEKLFLENWLYHEKLSWRLYLSPPQLSPLFMHVPITRNTKTYKFIKMRMEKSIFHNFP